MKNFTEVSFNERVAIVGGKDATVAKTAELLGYIIGCIVKGIKDAKDKKKPTATTSKLFYI